MQVVVQYMLLEVVEFDQGITDKQVDVVLPRWNPVLRLCEFLST